MLRLLAVSGQIAWKALGRNRLRTALTTLGVVIGVAAVIAMVALGNGARASVERTLKSAGTSIVQVSAGNFIKGGESMNIATGLGSATTLTRDDAQAIRGLANVQYVAAGLRSRTFIVASPEARVFTLVHGTEESLADIHAWTWLAGESFTADDVAKGQAVVVLGRIASARLFGEGSDPVGKRVTIHDREFRVVGMMRAVDRGSGRGGLRAGHHAGAAHEPRELPAVDHRGRHRGRRGHGRLAMRSPRCCARGTRRRLRSGRNPRGGRSADVARWAPGTVGRRVPGPTTSSCARWLRSR